MKSEKLVHTGMRDEEVALGENEYHDERDMRKDVRTGHPSATSSFSLNEDTISQTFCLIFGENFVLQHETEVRGLCSDSLILSYAHN